MDRVRGDPSQHDILLKPIPILKKGLIQLDRRGRLARVQPKLHHLRLLTRRAVNAVVWARWQGVFAVRGGENARLAVDLDGQATRYDLEIFPLALVEVGGWLFTRGFERFQARVVQLDLAVEVDGAVRGRRMLGYLEGALKSGCALGLERSQLGWV